MSYKGKKYLSLLLSFVLIFQSVYPSVILAETINETVPTENQISDDSEATVDPTQTPTPEISLTPEPTQTPTQLTPTPTVTDLDTNPTVAPTVMPTETESVEEVIVNNDNSSATPVTENNSESSGSLDNSTPTPTVNQEEAQTSVPEVVSDPSVICSSDISIRQTTASDWNKDFETGIAETKEKVMLGVKYVFPEDEKVSLVFTCLPSDENLHSTDPLPLK